MSTTYNFYIGYRDNKTNMVHVIGPYDELGNLHEVFYKTSSFISDLKDRFSEVNIDNIEEKYREKFTESSYFEEDKKFSRLYSLDISDLPNDDFVKSAYYLKEDVQNYLNNKDWDFDGFYEKIDPFTYSQMLTNELLFGKPEPKKDAEGYDITQYTASDYVWFCYPDYYGQEYEAFKLKYMANILIDKYDLKSGIRKDQDITPVALMHIC